MGFQLTTTLAAVTLFSLCSGRVITQNAISSVLQDIMSPANTDKAVQLINMMATRANKNVAIPNMPRAVIASNDCGLPARTIIANELPRAIITNDGMTRIISSEPRAFGPEIIYPQIPQQKIVRQIVREAPANFIELPREMYQAAPVTLPHERIACPYRTPVQAPNPYMPVDGLGTNPYLPVAGPAPNPYSPVVSPVPSPYLPFGAPSPFLPAASPLSAMSPSLMPPLTQSKGQFLRKIPIPPPSL